VYVFHRVDATGATVESFHAELDTASRDRLLHPYQKSLDSAIRLLRAIVEADSREVPREIGRAANDFRAVISEYLETGEPDED
jgi:hypothetical protein